MSSNAIPKMNKFRRYRERLKEQDPEKYRAQLDKQKERSKRNREARKLRWASEPQTRGLLQEIEDFKEKERKRWRESYARRQQGDKRKTRNGQHALDASAQLPTPKRPRDMNPDEHREHNRKLRENSRKREIPKKAWWRKKKDRESKQRKRTEKKEKKAATSLSPTVAASSSLLCSPVKKHEYNLVSRWRKILKKKSAGKFARLLKNLATKSSPPKQQAVAQEFGVHSSQAKLKDLLTKVKKKFLPAQKRKKRKDALSSEQKDFVRQFYFREDISRALPGKRYATKDGPGFVMQQTLKQAYQLFKIENPTFKLSYVMFTLLKPKNIRKISSAFLETCLCVYCLNVRLKVAALNKTLIKDSTLDRRLKVADEVEMYNMLLCQKDDQRFHQPQCVQGTCPHCGDYKGTIEQHYKTVLELNPTVTWSTWARGSAGREPTTRTGSARQLVDELIDDVCRPARSTSLVKHFFTQRWQHTQYRHLKKKMAVGQVLVVMDFAENKKSACQDEIKSAHFNKSQFSFHPVVAFYRTVEGGELVRHAVDFVTDDTSHDYHSVNHFTTLTVNYFKEKGVLQDGSELFIYSDNCSAQYKCKGTFADLSHYKDPVQRIYFGAEHGKGEADGETGVVSKKIEDAVLCRKVIIRGAEDFFNWCKANMTKDVPQSKRHFVYVKSEDINRDRPESEVKTVTGSSKFHHVLRVGPLMVKSRALACFCSPCKSGNFNMCINSAYVGNFSLHHLQPVNAQSDKDCGNAAPTSPPESEMRQEFFRKLQADLMTSRRNFSTFTACAQFCLQRASSFPLPSPIMEPEFERNQMDERAEGQRPEGAAPPDHFAKITVADGNCLVRSLSAAAYATDDLHTELRVRIACELALRRNTYLSPECIARGTDQDGMHLLTMMHASGDFHLVPSLEVAYECEVMAAVANSKDMGLWHLLASANVLSREIISIYPSANPVFNRRCLPDSETLIGGPPLYIQWTSVHDDEVDASWRANHFVPVVKDRHFVAGASTIHIGDYVLADFLTTGTDGHFETYRGVVVSRPHWMPDLDNEVCVKCLRSKDNGRYFVFPHVDDISSVPLLSVRKINPPTINNRGHYFF